MIHAKSFLVGLAISFASTTMSYAASSPWFEAYGAKLRLISLPSADGKNIDAGLQIVLNKGWKTYWRAPGASGIPPQINFLGSSNVAKTKMSFPVPLAFADGSGFSAGYVDEVVFPISVEALLPGRDIKLKANGLIGICGEICVPLQFELVLNETGKGFSSSDISAALLRGRSAEAQTPSENFQILDAQLNSKATSLEVRAVLPKGSKKASLFTEGPSGWYVAPVNAHELGDGKAMFNVDLRDIPKDANPHATKLRFSLVADGQGIEQELSPTN